MPPPGQSSPPPGRTAARPARAAGPIGPISPELPHQHRLQRMLRPRSIAVIGASERPESAPGTVLRKLQTAGFRGRIDPVNPKHRQVHGLPCIARIADLGAVPDLAVLGIRAAATPAALAELARLGVRHAMLVGHGPGRQRLVTLARRHGLRLLGPDSLGMVHPASGCDASLSRSRLTPGGLALISESAAVFAALLDTAEGAGIGLSQAVSTGSAADVDTADLLDFLGYDPATRAIAVYVEGVRDARRLLGSLRAAARAKPVVVLHAARSPAQHDIAQDDIAQDETSRRETAQDGATDDRPRAGRTRTHTEALASSDETLDAALRRCGAVCVRSYGELLGALEWLATGTRTHGDRLAIVSNGGGLATLAIDACRRMAIRPTPVTDRDPPRLPWNVGIDAGPAEIAAATREASADLGIDAVLGLFQPTRAAASVEVADALADALAGQPADRPTLVAFVGDADARHGADRLNAAGFSVFRTPEAAIRSFALLVEYHRSQAQILQAPSPGQTLRRFDEAAIQTLIDAAAAEGLRELDEVRAKRLLAACGIAVPATRVAADDDAAVAIAGQIGYPVVLKVLSPDIAHKSDVGGVVLDIADAGALRMAGRGIRQRLAAAVPGARFAGFSVQPMIRRGHGVELLVGISRDPALGPTIRFGAGGIATELTADSASALPPLNDALARELIGRTRIARLLDGYRGVPPVNQHVLVETLLALSTLACRFPAIRALDINPLLADADGALALDARVVLDRAPRRRDRRYSHLAIAPYPAEEERVHALRPAESEPRPPFVLVRPIRPDDAGLLVRFFDLLSEQTRHFRFLHPIRALPPQMVARFTQVDYDRDMAFVAELLPAPTGAGPAGGPDADSGPIIGVARYAREANAGHCEFAAVVADAWQRRGLARILMATLIDHARGAGLTTMQGVIHGQNRPMLHFVRDLGFVVGEDPDDPSLKLATLDLAAPARGAGQSLRPDRSAGRGLAR